MTTKYRVLIERIETDGGHRFYIQSTEDGAILYETPTEFVAEQVCDQWNRIGPSYRPDSTLDLP